MSYPPPGYGAPPPGSYPPPAGYPPAGEYPPAGYGAPPAQAPPPGHAAPPPGYDAYGQPQAIGYPPQQPSPGYPPQQPPPGYPPQQPPPGYPPQQQQQPAAGYPQQQPAAGYPPPAAGVEGYPQASGQPAPGQPPPAGGNPALQPHPEGQPPPTAAQPPVAGYPQQQPPAGYAQPAADGSYPPPGGYPPPAGSHPPPAAGYTPAAGGYPPPASGYPPQAPAGGYPPPASGYEAYGQPPPAGYPGYFPPPAGYPGYPPPGGYPGYGYFPPPGYYPPPGGYGAPPPGGDRRDRSGSRSRGRGRSRSRRGKRGGREDDDRDRDRDNKVTRRPAEPGCNICVFRLPPEWDEEDLQRHFDHYGEVVSCTVVKDNSGEPRGFGFVGYADKASVRKAIMGMDGLPVGGLYESPQKTLSVSPKKGEEGLLTAFPDCFPPAGTYGMEPPNIRAPPGGNLYVYSIPPDWKDIDLYRCFIHFGELTSVKVMMKDGSDEGRGFGFVGFVSPVAAQRAIAGMNGFRTPGRDRLRLQVTIKRGEENAAAAVKKQISFRDPADPNFGKDSEHDLSKEEMRKLADSSH